MYFCAMSMLDTIPEAIEAIRRGEVIIVVDDEDRENEGDFLRAALAAMPAEPWDGNTWGAWTGALKESTGRKGKALFLPLRQALTGHDHGPDMKALLPLIGRERAVARLEKAAA